MILWQLYWSFLQVGAFSVGGGYAAMPLIQAQTVERHHWLTLSEFTDLVSIAEMTPGPIAINAATFVGMRTAGLPGTAAATLGCITPSLVLVTLAALAYFRFKGLPAVRSLLASLRPAVVALIAGAGLSILWAVLFGGGAADLSHLDWLSAATFLGAFAVLRLKKCSPILVMAVCGGLWLGMGLVPAL